MPIILINSHEVEHLRERDWRLAHLIDYIGPLEYSKPKSAFHSLAHSIIEQMLSMKSASAIESRIDDLCGGSISPDAIASVTINEIRDCGVSYRKASNLHSLAKYANEHNLERLALLPDEDIERELLALPGVGKWTCDMFLLFYLEKEDILPIEDSAFRQAFKWLYGAPVDSEGIRCVVCDLWRPYSSTAVRYLYRALNTGLVSVKPAMELFAPQPEDHGLEHGKAHDSCPINVA